MKKQMLKWFYSLPKDERQDIWDETDHTFSGLLSELETILWYDIQDAKD